MTTIAVVTRETIYMSNLLYLVRGVSLVTNKKTLVRGASLCTNKKIHYHEIEAIYFYKSM